MCYEDGLWQAYLDQELDSEKMQEMTHHLQTCTACQHTLESLKEQQLLVSKLLGEYRNDKEKGNYSSLKGWFVLQEKIKAKNKRKGVLQMKNISKKVAVAAVAAVFGASLFLTPVRSAAAQFLQIFRAEKLATISISYNDMDEMRRAIEEGAKKIDFDAIGSMEFEETRENKNVDLEELREIAQFPVKLPEALPSEYKFTEANVSMPFRAKFKLNAPNVNQLIEGLGGTKFIPEEMDGKEFTIEVPQTVVIDYAKPDRGYIVICEGRSPEIKAPGDVNIEDLKDAVLELPVLPRELKSQLAGIKDWQHTLVIPNIEGSSQEVTVKGHKGVFVQEEHSEQVTMELKDKEASEGVDVNIDGEEHKAVVVDDSVSSYGMLIWEEEGVVYAVSGALDLDTALKIAESMR